MPIDYTKYPSNWKTIIRPAILKRAGHKCEECGISNNAIIEREGKEIKIVLTISHTDHNIKNNDYKNLKALCQRCHLSHDKNYHTNSRKYGKGHRGDHQLKMF